MATIKPLPPVLSTVVLVVSGAVAATAVAFAAVALFIGPKPAWMITGFELVAAVAGVLGVMASRGRFREGQGLALTCVGATIAVSAFLAWLSVQGRLQVRGRDEPFDLMSWLFAREAAAFLLIGVSVAAVLGRDPRSLRYLLTSMATGVPLVALAAGAFLFRSRLIPAIAAANTWVTVIGAGVLGVVCVVLISASGHCLIRAFEMGRTEQA